MSSKIVSIVCIGQTPRPDVLTFVNEKLGKNFKVVVKGALDGLNIKNIPEFDDQEYILRTTMIDEQGKRKGIRVTREFLTPLIQQRIDEINKTHSDVIIIWCAGRFPRFKSNITVVRPSEILRGVVEAIIAKGKIGVVYPSKEQLIWALPEWGRKEVEVYSDALGTLHSHEEELIMLAERMTKEKPDYILLNCASFGNDMKQIMIQKTGKPVIQANSITLQVVKELFN